MANPNMTTFIGGEVSSKFRGRSDIPKYYQSCRILEDMLVLPLGPVERRPGSPFVAESKLLDKKARLIAFEYTTSYKYMLEFGQQYIRVYRDHQQIQNGGSPYEVGGSPPYLESDLPDIKTVMIGHIMYLFHPGYAPRKLVCGGDTSWTMSTPYFHGWDKTTEKDITDATKASPVVITAAGHGYSNGDMVRITDVKGMVEINSKIFKVAGATTDTFELSGVDGTNYTEYVSGGKVIKDAQIFNSANNYPSCACVYGGRLIVGATNNNPGTYWGSKVNAQWNFIIDNEDDDAFMYEINATIGTRIKWILGKNGLIIGTNIGEFIVPGEGGYLTPTNALPYGPMTRHGSKGIQAQLVNDTILFTQRSGKVLREYLFEEASSGYIAPDLTMLAEHITGEGIVDLAVQTEPQAILWCVTSDGNLITLTYDRQFGIFAWSRQTTDGKVESIDIILGEAGNEDEIWISVNRKSYTLAKRYIEYFKPRDFGDDQSDCFFVDSGITTDYGSPKKIASATQAKPVHLGVYSHGCSNDDKVKITGTPGMTQLNGNVYTVKNATTNEFDLYTEDGSSEVDGTGFGALETVNITGTTILGSKEVTDVSSSDIAKLILGMYLTGTGVDDGALIVKIDSDNNKFTMSKKSDGSYIGAIIGCYGQVKKVTKTISGLSHLDDKSVSVLADGAAHPDKIVSSGSITLDRYANKVHAGLKYTSKLQPMQIGTPDLLKKISKLWIRFYKTLGCKAGPDENNLETLVFRRGSDPMDSPPPLSSEDMETPGWKGGSENEGNILVVQDQPLPMTILSLIPELEVHGD